MLLAEFKHSLSLAWALPFAGLLLSIALLPLFTSRLWHRHSWKVALFWALATVVPLGIKAGWAVAAHSTATTLLHEYTPFIILLLTLFTLSGGIVIEIRSQGTPLKNAFFLLVAMLSANVVGTTGAAMLFIRPWLQMNAVRLAKTHLVVFFIILVGNVGGCLSALGDPPLFLGFLKGVPFFWTTTHLFLPFVIVAAPLLLIFWSLDTYFFTREVRQGIVPSSAPFPNRPLQIQGGLNIFLLGIALGIIVLSGTAGNHNSFSLMGVSLESLSLLRDSLLLGLTGISCRFTSPKLREANRFTWEPIKEVAVLFFGIFITALPVISILQAGEKGALAPLFALVQHNGQPINSMYFWLCGGLSAFLDNAPTYLVFFSLAGGNAALLTGPLATTLTAISAGSVFMGALTYIGNAPNFMVKSIAESENIPMPTFFGYFARASLILIPLFVLLAWIMFS